MKKKVIALIPAKKYSRRLPYKNSLDVLGKPMVQWAIDEAKKSNYLDNIYVSTDDPKIKEVAHGAGVSVIDRPYHLTIDPVGKREVLEQALSVISRPDYICLLQANSPQLKVEDIDAAIEKVVLSRGAVKDCCSMNKETLFTDGAVRVFEYNVVFKQGPGMYQSCILTDYIDVHTPEDLEKVKKIMMEDPYYKSLDV